MPGKFRNSHKGPRLPSELREQAVESSHSGHVSTGRKHGSKALSRRDKRRLEKQQSKQQKQQNHLLKRKTPLAPSVEERISPPASKKRRLDNSRKQSGPNNGGQVYNKFREFLEEQKERYGMPAKKAKAGSADPPKEESFEDRQIRYLEEKLGLKDTKKRDNLNKEYAKDGLGGDFGDFLSDLDRLEKEVKQIANGQSDSKRKKKKGKNPKSEEDADEEIDADEDGSSEEEEDDEAVELSGGDDMVDSESEIDEETLEEMRLIREEDAELWDQIDELPTDDEESDEEVLLPQEDSIDEDGEEEEGSESDDQEVLDDDSEGEEEIMTHHKESESPKEDIYGRIKSAPQTQSVTKYVPPHLRNKKADGEDQELDEEEVKKRNVLKKEMNSLVNKISEENLDMILADMQKIYHSNSRSNSNAVFAERIKHAIHNEAQVLTSLVSVLAALVSGLHSSVGTEVGGYMIEYVCKQVDISLSLSETPEGSPSDGKGKVGHNQLLFLGYLFNYGVVHAVILHDIIKILVERFHEQDIDLLLLLLKHCGHQLRVEDPTVLKDIIAVVQQRANLALSDKVSAEGAGVSKVRVQVMLDLIYSLKTNKKNQTQLQEVEKMQRLRKWLGHVKSRSGGGGGDKCLRVSWDDIIHADDRGRWWIVGGTWTGRQKESQNDSNGLATGIDGEKQEKLLKLAAKQRMNTDVRRSIFCVIMGSEDCDDAFEKLLKLGLKDVQEREIPRVLVDCCRQEKGFNPYYALVSEKLCGYHSRFKFTFQLTFWDIFKQASATGASGQGEGEEGTLKTSTLSRPFDASARKARNLALMLAFLVQKFSLSLVILKVVDFTSLTGLTLLFFKIFFTELLVFSSSSDDSVTGNAAIADIFGRIASSQDFALVRDGVALFLHQHMSLSATSDPAKRNLLKQRLKIAKKVLNEMNVIPSASAGAQMSKKKKRSEEETFLM